MVAVIGVGAYATLRIVRSWAALSHRSRKPVEDGREQGPLFDDVNRPGSHFLHDDDQRGDG